MYSPQACLGESKSKGSEPVVLYVKVGNQKLVLGTLSSEKFPQVSFDLVFDKEFELSHNWKNGSVHFTGYTSLLPEEYPLSEFLRLFSILVFGFLFLKIKLINITSIHQF